ncbi:MAG: hypothetical protein HC887_10160 [Desulfobacteraceae bacterium]|nr:hypothetical protein [Desulfobacteraceae bacterium]
MSFESETGTFWALKNDVDRPTTENTYTIRVRATYYTTIDASNPSGLKNNPPPVETTFKLTYSTASLELDSVMDALQYLDTDGADMLPADGDQIPVQEMMAARGNAADANVEVSEVLALLDAEAYLFDAQQA